MKMETCRQKGYTRH